MPAFLSSDPPPASEVREYLLDGALFDERPTITIHDGADGTFERMELRYSAAKSPITLQRLRGEDADAALGEAIELAIRCGGDDIAVVLERCAIVLEWEVDRAQLDSDAWMALHLWQAYVLGPSGGWLHAPDDGLFDSALQRCLPAQQ